MADEDKDSKTEDPTAKKLSKSREDGQVAQSPEIKSFAMLAGALVIVAILAPWITDRIALMSIAFLDRPHMFHLDAEGLRDLLTTMLIQVGVLMVLPFGLLILLAVVASVAQFGFLWAPKRMAPKFNKISPIGGLKKLLSIRTLMEGFKGILKICLVLVVVYALLGPRLSNPERFMDQDMAVTLVELHELLILLLVAVLVMVAAIAAADFSFQKYKHNEDLKMTKQEVKDEHKNAEGDPQIKSKIRQLRLQRSRERMMTKVPEASVVVTNPTHFAVALKYDMESMAAPVLVAKGQDFIALKIREIAEENEVPIVENPPLARGLFAAVELDHEIPAEHYKAVAEIIGYVMRLKKSTQR
ncbi:MAG: flagellar biosynthesis protein FlhB [Rhodospirillum sp.]|nr:flagellar biosynthesis protein FlhB [Rhodospirillum sp.]MCF8488879.1 flagellar biosynthesis protein FlhB [Rhodospirillum sp.]